jgi:3-methyladenine DNA glycosylase AlkC
MSTTSPLKDQFFTRQFYHELASYLKNAYSHFQTDDFLAHVLDEQHEERALMERLRHATPILRQYLPQDFRQALDILYQIEPQCHHYGFDCLTFSDYVANYGLDDWEASLPALEQFTQHMTCEYAVRPFIIQDQAKMLAQMMQWAEHPNHHVRRLASEGCRPLLPWGIGIPSLKKDATPIIPILEKLKDDPEHFVRLSVANNLNDLSKTRPDLMLEVLERWAVDADDNRRWLINHALRTLIKQGNPRALALIGFSEGAHIRIRHLKVTPSKVKMGETVTFSFDVQSTSDEPQSLMIDYKVHFVRANGKRNAKVFKLSKRDLMPQEQISITKSHSFRPITTRRYYVGLHTIEIQINGVVYGTVDFSLQD